MDGEIDESLEDGEISNDSDNYTPLQRPENYSVSVPMARFPVLKNESESEVEESSSDSGSDSDPAAKKQKRPKLKAKPRPKPIPNGTSKKYTIWSTHMQEDVLADTMNTCDVTKKDRSRDVETYDYTLSRRNNKRTRDDRKNSQLRLVGRETEKEENRGAPRNLVDLVVTMENSVEEVAKDLANKLFEEKEDLILKIISIVGKDKAMKIFQEVKRIEKEGGMLIMNQSRRRTPGGVYFFLIKHDTELTEEQHNQIFENDKQRYKVEARAKRKQKAIKHKNKNAAAKKNLPELLTRAELCVNNIDSENWRSSKKETDHPDVANPPPTPETDCHDNSGDGIDPPQNKFIINDIPDRPTQDYDDDFLDLGTAHDMDFF